MKEKELRSVDVGGIMKEKTYEGGVSHEDPSREVLRAVDGDAAICVSVHELRV